MHRVLENYGQTVDFIPAETSGAASITDLATAIKGGSVKTLVILGGNPAYNAPADLDWSALQKSVAEVVRQSESNRRNFSLARQSRDITVPAGHSSMLAICW